MVICMVRLARRGERQESKQQHTVEGWDLCELTDHSIALVPNELLDVSIAEDGLLSSTYLNSTLVLGE